MQDLSYLGIRNVGRIHHNLSTPALYEEAIRRREGWISHLGPLVVRTGQYTGRSAEDKFVVREPESEGRIWWGKHNRPIEPERFAQLKMRLQASFRAARSSCRTATREPIPSIASGCG